MYKKKNVITEQKLITGQVSALQPANDDSYDSSKIRLKKIEEFAEKKKWMECFCKAYKKGQNKNPDIYNKLATFYVAIDAENNEVGFMRLTDYSSNFTPYTDEVIFNLSEAYVIPKYRHQNILKKMIINATDELNLKMIFIDRVTYLENLDYYLSLGFGFFFPDGETMIRAFNGNFKGIVSQKNYGPIIDVEYILFREQLAKRLKVG
jgi:hypothetical protein